MGKLDELIAELCPQGVGYKKLGDIATISRGGNFQKKDFVEQGIPCIHYGQIYTYYGLFVNETISFIEEEMARKQKMAVTNDVIMAVTSENIDDVCKCIVWLGEGQVAVSGHTAIIHHNQNPKYMVYYLRSSMFYKQKTKLAHGTKVIEVTPDKLANIIIPVPPLVVQDKIVRILDDFTELTSKLISELTAELTARKKQYEYYRNLLLQPVSERADFFYYTIDEICSISRGKVISKDYIRDNIGIYPVYSSQTENNGVLGKIDTYEFDGEYLTWTTDGANAGSVFYRNGKFSITNVCGLLKSNDIKVLTRYLYFILRIIAPKYVVRGMGNPKLMSNVMARIKVPVPSLEQQKRIVSLLDSFEAVHSEFNTDIPAEIEARQRQYKYYRDKLLTFKELSE